jgi:hypothetical protein
MTPKAAEPPRRFRIGVTAPDTPLAREIRSVFRREGYPVSRFVPLGDPGEEGKLSELDGEAAVVETPRRETVGDLDLLILAGSAADGSARGLARENDVPIHDASAVPPAAEGCRVLLDSLPAAPLEASFTLLLPAAEEADRGIHELFAQTGDAINMKPPAADVFRERLAFNLFRDSRTARIEKAVRSELEKGAPGTAVSVLCARAGIFHCYAGSAILRHRSSREARLAAGALGRNPRLSMGKTPGHASPAQASESPEVRLDPPQADGDRLCLWFAFDGLALAAARAFAAARERLG